MDIITHLAMEPSQRDFLTTLIILFGISEVITAIQFGNIKLEESTDLEYTTATLNIN